MNGWMDLGEKLNERSERWCDLGGLFQKNKEKNEFFGWFLELGLGFWGIGSDAGGRGSGGDLEAIWAFVVRLFGLFTRRRFWLGRKFARDSLR